MPLSNDLAALIGFACEAVLWGVNCTLFCTSLIILRRRRFRENLFNPVISLTTLIFLCCTTHFALEFNHFYTTLSAIGVDGYANETTQLVGADYLISFTDFLGDLTLIYRCWMLWDKNYYIVVLPFLAAVGGLASLTATVILLSMVDPTSPTPPPVLVPLTLAAYTLPLCTNVIVTSLIVFRIWIFTSSASDFPLQGGQRGQRAPHRAMMLIIESGALYLLFQLVFVVLVAVQNAAEAIVAVMAVQIYGIAPTLIVIRVGLGLSAEQTSGAIATTRIKWVMGRGEESGMLATHGLVTHTDNEHAHALSDDHAACDVEKAVQRVDTCNSDGGSRV